MDPLLQIENLRIKFRQGQKEIAAVRGVDFQIDRGQTIAIVGESGCGKSTIAHAIMGLLTDKQEKIINGHIWFEKQDLLTLSPSQMNNIRGCKIGMIFQDPMNSLNPLMTIRDQITEGMRHHLGLSARVAHLHALEMLKLVGINQPEKRMKQYPHQFSGGMRQRVMIAIALACQPKLLIADEPTTALDVTIQYQILKLLQEIQKKCR